MPALKVPFPRCAVCLNNPPVKRFEKTGDLPDGGMVFTATCHGERREYPLTYEMLCELQTPTERIEIGFAFAPRLGLLPQ